MRHLLTASVGVAVCALLLTGCYGPETRKVKFYARGKALYEKGELQKARLELKNAVQIDPRFGTAQRLLGMVELKRGDLNAARAAFSRAVEIDRGDLDAHLELGKLLMMQGALDKAAEKAELVLRAHPGHQEALLLRGAVLLASGRPERAAAVAGGVVRGGCGLPDAYLLLAVAQRRCKDPEGAERTLRSGVSLHPGSLALHRALADLYAERGKTDAAAEELRQMIRLEPSNAGYPITLAGLLWQTGREAQARALLDALLKGGGRGEEVFQNVAAFYLRRRLYPDAEKVLRQGISLHGASHRLHLALGGLYATSGRVEGGVALLKEYLARRGGGRGEPPVLAVKTALAAMQMERGEVAEAARLADEVLHGSPHHHEANLLKGRIALLQGNGPAAVTAFRTIVSDRPEDLDGYFLLAEALMLNREMDLALETLRQAQRLEPNSRETRLALARYYLRGHDFASAEGELRSALAAAPDDPRVLTGLGDLYLARNEPRRAEEWYARSARSPGGEALGRVNLGNLYAFTGETARAAEEFAKAAAAAPEREELFNRLIQLYLREGRYPEAAATCRKRIAANPRDVAAYLALGTVLAREGAYGKGEEAIVQAARIAGGSTRTSLALAQLKAWAGDRQKARALFEEILAKDPDSVEAANDLACLLADAGAGGGDLRRALKLAGRAAARRPGDPLLMDTLGWVRYRRGEYRQAAALLQQAAARLPGTAVVRYHAGMALYRAGNEAAAREHLRAAAGSRVRFAGQKEAQETLRLLK